MMFPAKAHHVDAVREHLERQHSPVGFERLAKQLRIPKDDLRSALSYLIGRGEIVHEQHCGYRYLPDLERELLRRVAARKAKEAVSK
jgi:hypothetical protein